jgi:hypothetical protein
MAQSIERQTTVREVRSSTQALVHNFFFFGFYFNILIFCGFFKGVGLNGKGRAGRGARNKNI